MEIIEKLLCFKFDYVKKNIVLRNNQRTGFFFFVLYTPPHITHLLAICLQISRDFN